MYDYTDKVIVFLNRRFVELFGSVKNLSQTEESDVFKSVNTLYKKLLGITKKMYLKIARNAYRKAGGRGALLTEDWLEEFLEEHDPVTKYVFTHEADRKRARLAESMIASDTPNTEVDKAMRYWSRAAAWYAIEITDKATLAAYEKSGVKHVRWISKNDKTRCAVCKERDGVIYDILRVPHKPHINCRCYLIPCEGE